MPDWQQFVRERLGPLGISPQRDDEITVELAAHLEDRFNSEPSAECSSEVADWHRLACDLRRASTEDDMKSRTRSFWIPALLTLAAASLLWRILLMAGLEPRVILVNEKKLQVMYLFAPWLLALPLIGAAATLWARRLGATPRQRLLISVFPAVAMFGVISIGIPGQLVVNPSVFVKYTGGILLFYTSFVFIPAACLLLGALPFLRNGAPAGHRTA